MADAAARALCVACGRPILFADWRRGARECRECEAGLAPRPAPPRPKQRHMAMLDEIPEELIDQLVRALEAEAAIRQTEPAPADDPLRGLLEELGVGRSDRELPWAAWGFSIGFGGNVLLAKYAQMSSGESFGAFVVPMLLGGVVAGVACAAIGWGLARLRDRSS